MKIAFFVVLAGFTVVSMSAVADDATTNAFNTGKEVASQQSSSISKQITTDKAQQVPNYTTNSKESSLYQDGQGAISPSASAKVVDCKTSKASSDYNQQECDAVNFLSKNPSVRPQYSITSSDSLITSSKQIISNATTTASYSGCTTSTVAGTTTYESVMCNIGKSVEQATCKKNLSVTCTSGGTGCGDSGAVSVSSNWPVSTGTDAAGNFSISFGYPQRCSLQGTDDNNYTFEGTLTLQIDDMSKVPDVLVNNITRGNWAWVKINGTTFYIWGPGVGSRPAYTPTIEVIDGCLDGDDSWICGKVVSVYGGQLAEFHEKVDYGTDIGVESLNQSILSQLHKGINTVWFRTIGNCTHAAMTFSISEVCQPVCTDHWDDQCSAYEARAQ